MSGATAEIERLQQSIAQVQQLRSSAAVSIGMMALGVAILVGGVAYTAAQIGPLERRADTLRRDIEVLNRDALAKRTELVQSTEAVNAARIALAATQARLDSINTTLQRLASTGALTPAARSEVTSALESGQRAEVTVAAAEENLPATVRRPPAGQARESLDVLIARLFDESSVVRLRAYDDVMAQHAASPELVPALLRYAETRTDNLNGIYNTLVVLNTLPRRSLAANEPEVRAFLERVEGRGRRIKARADDVRARLSGR